jgi:O-antigen ligase
MTAAVRGRAALPACGAAAAFTFGVLAAIKPELAERGFGLLVFLGLLALSVPAAIAIWVAALFVALGIVTSGLELLIVAVWAGSIVARPARLRQVLPGQRVLIGALALLMAWLSLSTLWARNPELTWQELRMWLVASGMMIVVATSIGRPEHVKLVMLGFVAGALASVVLGWLQGTTALVATADNPVAHLAIRFSGLEGNPNDLAADLIPAIVFAAVLLIDARRLVVRLAFGAAIAVLTIGFAATGSRGGLVAAAVVVVVAALSIRRQRRLVLGAITSVAVIAGIWLAVSPTALHHVTSFSDGGDGRQTLWLVAWRIAKDYAPEGVGLNNFRDVAPDYLREPGLLRGVPGIDSGHVVHNAYLELLTETGPIGLLLFLAVAGACLGAARRALRVFERTGRAELEPLAHAVVLAGVGLLVTQLFGSRAYDPRLWVVFALGPTLFSLASAA